MTPIELLSWQVDPTTLRLEAEVVVTDIELPRRPNDCYPDYFHSARCTAYVSLGNLDEWPQTEEDRLAFLDAHAVFETMGE
jgi:hypothetical protein